MAQLLKMTLNRIWFDEALQRKRLSQRGLAKLLGCDPSSVHRLLHGKRPMRFDEAQKLSVFLGVPAADVLINAGLDLEIESQEKKTKLVGYIDGAGEAHIDWDANDERVPTIPSLPPTTVAVQYRTAMTAWDSFDGWTIYVEPPNGRVDHAVNRLALVTLESGITVLSFLRRGYKPDTYNMQNFGTAMIEGARVRWATPVLLLRP